MNKFVPQDLVSVIVSKYAKSNVVTARVDELEFYLPIFVASWIIL
jgi:acyl-CoA hydrolase